MPRKVKRTGSRAPKAQKKPATGKVSKKTSSAVVKCPSKLKTGKIATYGELLKTTGDGTSDRDHIPSYKALEKRATFLKGRSLTKQEKSKVKRAGKAIVLPKSVHKQGRTFGGKNTNTQSGEDAGNLSGAASKDIRAYEKLGVDTSTVSAMKTMQMTNKEYDDTLMKLLDV
ncbi:MAG: hypothetical protein ABI318_11430 [Chthoniobacteraceae bacterium]